MKTFTYLTAFILVILSTLACADGFYIEKETLKSLPKPVEAAIRMQKKFGLFKPCKLIGEAINLSDKKSDSSFIVTTSDACGWAASAGPIWIMSKINDSYNVILNFVTYSAELKTDKINGMRQIVTSRSTASLAEYELWSFGGKHYKIVKSYAFAYDDEKLCKAHQDICPWQF